MANISAAAPIAPGEFRVGQVFSRSFTLLSRNFLIFFVVAMVAALPNVLIGQGTGRAASGATAGWLVLSLILTVALQMLSQAIILYGAFQDMRGRAVNLGEALRVALGRLLPIIGVALCVGFGVFLASLLLLVPGLILMTMWYVATPVCVVEQTGPLASMGRSSELTKGHRWKIFGMILLVVLGGGIVSAIILALLANVGSVLEILGSLIWNGVWGAFYAIFVVVTYHDLRVAKEGVDVNQIASVFD
jgi:MFS family permease